MRKLIISLRVDAKKTDNGAKLSADVTFSLLTRTQIKERYVGWNAWPKRFPIIHWRDEG